MYDSSGRRFSLDLSKQLAESIVSVASRAGGPHSGLTGIVVLALGELLSSEEFRCSPIKSTRQRRRIDKED